MEQPREHVPFLSGERTPPAELADELARAAHSPLVTAVLEASATAAAVLDRHREVIAVNAAYLRTVGAEHPEEVLGLRPGEVVGCIHVEAAEKGCGTGQACPTCGAALALVSVLRDGRPDERRCALATTGPGGRLERELRVRASPLELDGERFVVLTMVDVTEESRRAMMERAFIHDLANLAVGLQAATEALAPGFDAAAEDARALADQLVRQVRLQRALAYAGEQYAPLLERVTVGAAMDLLRRMVERHPASQGRTIAWPRPRWDLAVRADGVLLGHVLLNLTLNALEATPAGGRVQLEVVAGEEAHRFRVWNAGAIPAAVVPRIFQRHFSTKREAGRGHGTWVVKTFGEDLLGGRVSFTTSAADGTCFELALPAEAAAPG